METNEEVKTVVTVTEKQPESAPAVKVKSAFWEYYILYVGVMTLTMFGLLFFGLADPVGAQSNSINIDAQAVQEGIFTGANIILGAGILGIILLPAGIKFGLNLIYDLVGAFSNIRLGR